MAAKRTLDTFSQGTGNQQPQKTGRTHLENQERAYIAASRRGDRSIEARVASARQASDIHKRRTGKGFRITEQIVQQEEMYEEEEDFIPRHYRNLTAHLLTSSPATNQRFEAAVANRAAMAATVAQREAHLQAIEREFAEQFPNVQRFNTQGPNIPFSPTPPFSPTSPYSPTSQHFGGQNFDGRMAGVPPSVVPYPPRGRTQSMPQVSQLSPYQQANGLPDFGPPSPAIRHGSVDGQFSPSSSIPSSVGSATPQSQSTPISNYTDDEQILKRRASGIPVDHPLVMPHGSTGLSSFTSDLPAETKAMINLDLTDLSQPYQFSFYGGPDLDNPPTQQGHNSQTMYRQPPFEPGCTTLASSEPVYNSPEAQSQDAQVGNTGRGSAISTPNVENIDWDKWLTQ
ncbi:hypothetical protein B0H66DRAFT_176642 [Apodospora peruviana]|uniref:Uncharacterized protein n=1 Tax=Apodospora peruviana TaxID=516989 RepID=A0AAE0IAN1_9PEZI|nr:hypothetical protein B0H66DRAFT_176642 [Apodospora peruviana]